MSDKKLHELQQDRRSLLEQVHRLEDELESLRRQLSDVEAEIEAAKAPAITLSLDEKVALFRSLFRGREDVFARRWQSRTSGKSGYQPVCINEWNPEFCDKRQYKCAECPNRRFAPLTDGDVYRHLEGKSADCRDVVGLYVLNADNTCHLLCADFDDKNCEHGYEDDVRAFVAVCRDWGVPCSVERSRSGNGAHVWIFFGEPILAAKARKLGNAILTEAMGRDARLSFKSYDRFLPNQDVLPEGGLGNLVALPLQGQARRHGNSVFVDDSFEPYADQWAYLLTVDKLAEWQVDAVLSLHAPAMPMGPLSSTSETKPWETPPAPVIDSSDFAGRLVIVRSNALYLPLKALSAKVANHLKRIASFRNPEFYTRQALRLTTYNVPRIISCAEIVGDYLALPRGCEDAVISFLSEKGADFEFVDDTCRGTTIDVVFNGELRPDQQDAVDELCRRSTGVLSGTTAFGKTVAACGLIARLKVNTLILVHTKALLDQWQQKFEEFLIINHEPAEVVPQRGRRKAWSPIGTLSSGGNSLHGIIDIALLQSCESEGEVKPFVRDYGMVIVDECHHVSAVNFERVLKQVKAARVYGLTATPIRKDGHQPIIFMQCGPIRYTVDSLQQMRSQTFARLLVPRFTAYRCENRDNQSYANIITQLAADEYRNRLIVNDVRDVLEDGRSPIVLTSLTSHVATLASRLRAVCPNVFILIGSESAGEKRLKMQQLQSLGNDEPMVIVATGKYAGEGFDLPRLDTLFLVLPVSWKGLVAQYAGRLHRDYEGKDEVRIYDYIDINVPVCEAMYRRRLKGYAGIGYSLKPQGLFADVEDETSQIYDGHTFLAPFMRSLAQVRHSLVIACPKVSAAARAAANHPSSRQAGSTGSNSRLMTMLLALVPRVVKVTVVTRERNEHTDRLAQHGINVIFKPDLALNCAILDRATVWYGSVPILGYHSPADNMITLHAPDLATRLLPHLLE